MVAVVSYDVLLVALEVLELPSVTVVVVSDIELLETALDELEGVTMTVVVVSEAELLVRLELAEIVVVTKVVDTSLDEDKVVLELEKESTGEMELVLDEAGVELELEELPMVLELDEGDADVAEVVLEVDEVAMLELESDVAEVVLEEDEVASLELETVTVAVVVDKSLEESELEPVDMDADVVELVVLLELFCCLGRS